MLAAGQAARASLCLKVLLEGSLDQQMPDILVLMFLVKSGFTTGTVASLQGALGHARSEVKTSMSDLYSCYDAPGSASVNTS